MSVEPSSPCSPNFAISERSHCSTRLSCLTIGARLPSAKARAVSRTMRSSSVSRPSSSSGSSHANEGQVTFGSDATLLSDIDQLLLIYFTLKKTGGSGKASLAARLLAPIPHRRTAILAEDSPAR